MVSTTGAPAPISRPTTGANASERPTAYGVGSVPTSRPGIGITVRDRVASARDATRTGLYSEAIAHTACPGQPGLVALH